MVDAGPSAVPAGRTVADLVDEHEGQLFTGRGQEVERFETWLDGGPAPALFHVTGRGGVGKTALLRQFARVARQRGREVRYVDARSIPPTPAGLVAALGASDLDDLVRQVRDARTVLLLDTFESNLGLARHVLHDVVPRLDVGTRIVLATRQSLPAMAAGDPLPGGLVERLHLEGFSAEESQRYLARRGVHDANRVARIVAACAGNPLATSLAVDLVIESVAPDLVASSDWREAVSILARRLLRDIDDPRVRELLEAAVVLRSFDQDLLAACVGAGAAEAYAALCRMAVVRPAQRGWKVHDDVREVVRADLDQRRPGRSAELRSLALDHLQQRMERASGPERAHLLNDRLYLWEDAAIRTLVFDHEDEQVSEDPATVHDSAEVLALWDRTADVLVPIAGGTASQDLDGATLERMVGHPASTSSVARRPDGTIAGFGPSVVEGPGWLEILPPIAARFVDQHLDDPGLPHPFAWFGPIFGEPEDLPSVYATLVQGMLAAWLRGGTFFVVTRRQGFASMIAAALQTEALSVEMPDGEVVQGYRLALPPERVDTWVQALLASAERATGPPAGPDPASAPAPAASSGPAPVSADGGSSSPADRPPVLSIRLLGGVELRATDGSVVEPPAGHPGTIIECVAAAGGRLSIDQLVELLWPDVDPEVGRRRLPNVLTRVRERCGPLLTRERNAIVLASGVVTDVQLFETAAARAVEAAQAGSPDAEPLVRHALACHGGELLPDRRYADWAAGPRERLRRRSLELLDLLIALRERAGDRGEALALLERAIALEPYDDRRYVQGARLQLGAGNHTAAARWCDRADEVLAELGLVSPPALRQIRAHLAHGGAQDASS